MERASYDSKTVITTYEGQHDHEIAPGRTVTHNAATNTRTTATNGKVGSKSTGNTDDTGKDDKPLVMQIIRMTKKDM